MHVQVLQPAIELAENGFPVSPVTACARHPTTPLPAQTLLCIMICTCLLHVQYYVWVKWHGQCAKLVSVCPYVFWSGLSPSFCMCACRNRAAKPSLFANIGTHRIECSCGGSNFNKLPRRLLGACTNAPETCSRSLQASVGRGCGADDEGKWRGCASVHERKWAPAARGAAAAQPPIWQRRSGLLQSMARSRVRILD